MFLRFRGLRELDSVSSSLRWGWFWEMRLGKCAGGCSESSISNSLKTTTEASDQSRICAWAISGPTWWRVCMTKLSGTAARKKELVMLRRSCFAGLQPEVAKRIATAATKPVFEWLCGHVPLPCNKGLQLVAAKRIVLAARREELSHRSYRRCSAEKKQLGGAQGRSRSEKKWLREEVPQRRGSSAKRCFSEQIAQGTNGLEKAWLSKWVA